MSTSSGQDPPDPNREEAKLEDDSSAGFADPESPNSKGDSSSSSSEGVLVEHPEHLEESSRRGRGEDGGREDNFVDAPEELGYAEGRGGASGLEESMAMIEIGENTRDKQLMDEVNRLREECRGYKEERVVIGREVGVIRSRLKGLIDHQSQFSGTRDEVAVEHFQQEENEVSRDLAITLPLHLLLSDCSKLVLDLGIRLDEQLQSEAIVRELHAIISTKDQEIETLNVKLSECSISHDVVASYVDSVKNEQSESLKESSEAVLNKLLASLELVVHDDVMEASSVDKVTSIEKKTMVLIEKYARIRNEIEQLGQYLPAPMADSATREGEKLSVILDAAQNELVEGRNRELSFYDKINELEKEKTEMLEKQESMRRDLEEAKSEASKNKLECEHIEHKFLAAKDKLGIAVTKGKSLVQHRDSLKQSLAENALELERCQQELQQKCVALEAAEETIRDLKQSQELVLSLRDSIAERDNSLSEVEEAISQSDLPKELQSARAVDKIRWLVNQKNTLSLESSKLHDIMASCKLPDTFSSTSLEHQIKWLGESYELAKEDIDMLHAQLVNAQAASGSFQAELSEARKEIEHLTDFLFVEKQEKDTLQVVHDDLIRKYEGTIDALSRLSSETHELLRVLGDVSGIPMDDGISNEVGDFAEKCIRKIRERLNSLPDEPSSAITENFQRMQSSLYVINQDLVLHEKMLEEDMANREEIINLSDELRKKTEEIVDLRNERDSLEKDLERAEEKYSLAREKLSMAVKKGKGLVQEREGLKHSLDEKNSEIDKLKHELKSLESEVSESKEKISILTSDLVQEREGSKHSLEEKDSEIEKLKHELKLQESAIMEFKEKIGILTSDLAQEREDFKHSLHDKDSEIEKLKDELESQESAAIEFKENIGALTANLVQEREEFKHSLDDKDSEIEKLMDELKFQESTVIECKEKINVLTSGLEHTHKLESDFISMKDEKGQLEHFLVESNGMLQRVIESLEQVVLPFEATFDEPVERVNAVAQYLRECEAAKVYAEEELEKIKEEIVLQTNKLTDSYETIKSLEDALSDAEKRMNINFEEKEKLQLAIASTELELKKVNEEANIKRRELEEAKAAVSSLDDDLSNAKNKISLLVEEREETEAKSKQDIDELNAKVALCMEELAGTSGSLENQSVELVSQFRHLLSLSKDDGLLSSVTRRFSRSITDLKTMVPLIQRIHDQTGEAELEADPSKETNAVAKLLHLQNFEDYISEEIRNLDAEAAEPPDGTPSFAMVAKCFSARTKCLRESAECFSTCLDDHIVLLLQALQETRDKVTHVSELKEYYKLKLTEQETSSKAKEAELSSLQNDLSTMHSACSDTIQILQIDFHDILDIDRNLSSYKEHMEVGDQRDASNHARQAENLLLAAKRTKSNIDKFSEAKFVWAGSVEELKNKLKETEVIAESALQDKEICHTQIIKLDEEIEALKSIIDEYQEKEQIWKDKEEEFVSLKRQVDEKDREGKTSILEGEMETLFSKVDKMEIPFKDVEAEGQKQYFSSSTEKLFYILDNFEALQHKMRYISTEKENLQSALSLQTNEVNQLKMEAESSVTTNQELENRKSDINELTMRLERLVHKLGDSDSLEDKKSLDAKGLVSLLERLIIASIQDSENSKSKAKELGAKLLSAQKFIDELSAKVKFLEESAQARSASLDTMERGIFESSSSVAGSEISEIEDVGPLGKKSLAPMPPAAQYRPIRKGSNEHLILNIDTESDRLLGSHDNGDKGHVFKSLNTSGLIPKQGKLIADRVDSIWVSGGRFLMGKPGARIGFIAYWIFLHIWLLGTIL